MRTYVNRREGEVVSMRKFTYKFLNLVPCQEPTCNNYQIFR